LLYNKKNKVRDALRARFDRLACLTGSLAKYVTSISILTLVNPELFSIDSDYMHVHCDYATQYSFRFDYVSGSAVSNILSVLSVCISSMVT
jgi:hypothetical protein